MQNGQFRKNTIFSGKGYTLIEVLVVITILGILFSIGYANYRDFGRRQALVGSVKQLEGDIRMVQQNALSGIKPQDTICDTNTLTNYQIEMDCNDPDDCKYTINANCSDHTVLVQTKTLSGVSISSTQNPIIFELLGRGASEAVITLTQEVTGKTSTIIVGTGGNTNIQ